MVDVAVLVGHYLVIVEVLEDLVKSCATTLQVLLLALDDSVLVALQRHQVIPGGALLGHHASVEGHQLHVLGARSRDPHVVERHHGLEQARRCIHLLRSRRRLVKHVGQVLQREASVRSELFEEVLHVVSAQILLNKRLLFDGLVVLIVAVLLGLVLEVGEDPLLELVGVLAIGVASSRLGQLPVEVLDALLRLGRVLALPCVRLRGMLLVKIHGLTFQ